MTDLRPHRYQYGGFEVQGDCAVCGHVPDSKIHSPERRAEPAEAECERGDMTERYRTIVVDPPWHYGKFNAFSSGHSTTSAAALRAGGRLQLDGHPKPLPYPTMSVDEIAGLPVSALADPEAHLYLWTTQRYLWDAPHIVREWGFTPSCVLTWTKPVGGSALGFAFVPTTEFVLFAHRGGLSPVERWRSTWFSAGRSYHKGGGGPIHSAKPDAFLDIVETVSPGPYLELFARRQRLGWDTWGNEALNHVELAARGGRQ